MFALWMLITVAHSQNQTRLDVNSQECQIYINKFYTQLTDIPSLLFSGWAEFSGLYRIVDAGTVCQLTLYYYDSLFQDQKYYGIVQQDGKFPNETCFDLKLWQFSSEAFNDPQERKIDFGCFGIPQNFCGYFYPLQCNNTKITSFCNLEVRYFEKHFYPKEKTLQQNSVFDFFSEFWALSYYLVGSNDDFFSFYFYVTTTRQPFNYTNDPDCWAWCFDDYIRIYFHPFNFFETQNCSISFKNCTIKYTTILKWCTDATCSQFITSPKLVLNESFYLLITINQTEFKDNYIIDTKAYLQGEALDYEIIPLSVQNSIKGQSIIELQSNIVWSNFRILVTSYLTSSFNQTQTYPVNGHIDKIQCIFMNSNSTECPSCDDEQNTNGFAKIECKQDYKLTIFMILVMIAMLT